MRTRSLLAVSAVLILASCGGGSQSAPETTVAPVALTCASGGICAIGDTGPGGGIVFYDAGSLQSWGRYLEAAPNTWSNTAGDPKMEWGCSNAFTPGALGTAIGTGAANTAAIVAGCFISGDAAKLADALTFGGKSDWFLPSKDELNLMYINLKRQGIGDLDAVGYWSSSEILAGAAWFQFFYGGDLGVEGDQGYGFKFYAYSVRPVRAFG